MSASSKNKLVLMGECGRAHGLKGEVRLKSWTADPTAIATYNPLQDEAGQTYHLVSCRPSGSAPDLLVAVFKEIDTREKAEKLNGLKLYMGRERLTPVQEENEFYLADLIGLEVFDGQNTLMGHVTNVPNFGAGDLLEIQPPSKSSSFLILFTEAFVPVVDIKAGRIVIDLPDNFFETEVAP